MPCRPSSARPSPPRPPPATPPGPTAWSPSTSRSTPCGRCSTPTATPAAAAPARLQVHLSWAPTDDEALAIAHDQWRSNVHGPPVSWDTETVEAFDVMAQTVTPEQVAEVVNVSSDPGQHAAWLQEYVDQGWEEIYLHFVGQEQQAFIDTFGEHVLPSSPGHRHRPRPTAGRRARGGHR